MPLGGSGGEHGYGEPAAARGGRDEEDPSCSPHPAPLPLLPGLAVVPMASENEKKNKKLKHVRQEDALMEILSRVPCRPLCRFKCVSKEWLALCSYSHVHKRSPQAMSGFFYNDHGCRFHNLSGKGPPMVDPDLSFLRSSYKHFCVTQCSNSLLLCKCWKVLSVPYPKQLGWNSLPKGKPEQFFEWPEADEFDHVVCNPATQEWTSLPPIELPDHLPLFRPSKYFLGFDAAIPSRFVVFVPLNSSQTYGLSADMIYSSDTGGWTFTQHNDFSTYPISYLESTFLNNTMHFPTRYSVIVTVDMERKDWTEIKMPRGMTNEYGDVSIGKSQGRLFAWHIKNEGDYQLSIWVLENYDSGNWTLKCTVSCSKLFGRDCRENYESYSMFAIHPECNLIFLTDNKKKTLSYDMDNQEVHIICATGDFLEGLPYTPSFVEWTSDGH
ncbi:hypothetical protein VPH35_135924 [Triticum aestivum]|uniref:uncharacterized protein n=1 Tax=Triticum aestivum TaxID=4565 RepID=UPI00098B28D2|nr:uncharacterized protein LOC123165972 [Triticum aestivum]